MSDEINFYSTETNAVTGDVTITPYTEEQKAAVLAEIRKGQVPASITRRQCAIRMLEMAMISGSEAIAMTQSGVPPAAVAAYLTTLPEPDRTLATIDFAAMNYYRDNPLLAALMVANNMSEEDVDTFFIEAGKK